MYTHTDYKTKKALKEDVAAGKEVTYYDPGPHKTWRPDGIFVVSGPHFPRPHRFWAECVAKDGKIISVK